MLGHRSDPTYCSKSSDGQSFQPRFVTGRLKKPPQAPKRFKSSFIFFSMEKHKEIKAKAIAENRLQKVTYVGEKVRLRFHPIHSETFATLFATLIRRQTLQKLLPKHGRAFLLMTEKSGKQWLDKTKNGSRWKSLCTKGHGKFPLGDGPSKIPHPPSVPCQRFWHIPTSEGAH